MEGISLIYFYRVGFQIGRLHQLCVSDQELNHWRWSSAIKDARLWLENFHKDEIKILPKTKRAAGVFVETIDSFSSLLGQPRKPELDEWSRLTNAVDRFQNVFDQEIEDTFTFCITPIGAYSTTALITNAELHLSEIARKAIGEVARADYRSAGSCLALDHFTASGFHSMRALEAVSRGYHKIVTGISDVLTDTPLGPLINGSKGSPGLRTQWEIEGSHNDSMLGLIVSTLSHVNKVYRSPIMHPEMILDHDQAKLVFDTAALAINAMVADSIERIEKKTDAASPGPAPEIDAGQNVSSDQ
jgi:hypothetical protein